MKKIRDFNKNLKESRKPTAKEKGDQPFTERRSGSADRRQTHTFILDDRRSGIADRRRKPRFKP